MRVRFLQHLCGPNVNHYPGDVADFPDSEAERLVAAGAAEAVVEPARDERATAETAPRKATRR